MNRLFELTRRTYEGDVESIIDLDKLCWLKIEKNPREHYPHLVAHFVDGHEQHDIMMDPSAYRFVEAYRAYLAGKSLDKHARPLKARSCPTPTMPDTSPASMTGKAAFVAH